MSIQKIPVAGLTYTTEQSTALVPVTGSGTPSPNSSNILTYTTTGAHGLVAGQAVTFTGATPSGYNTTTFVVLSVPSTTTFTIQTTLGQITVAGSVVPVFFLPAGMYNIVTGANAVVQYNPDNTGYVDAGRIAASTNISTPPTATIPAPTPQSATGATWRTLIAASSNGMFWTDGYGVRLICSGTAATTYYSLVE